MSYQLQKYAGRNTRHSCPNCGKEHCFTLYVDENNNPLDKTVGRCDHEESCGYHYTPKQFFAEHPTETRIESWRQIEIQSKRQLTKTTNTISYEYLQKTIGGRNNFIDFLYSLTDNGQLAKTNIERVIQEYNIGSTKNGRAIFWQIDLNNNVRTGKIIAYDAKSGHRYKSISPDWVHSLLKKSKKIPEDWEVTQCIYGEHLLKKYPEKTVALVEAEKTAIICAAIFPQYVWVSIGSVQNLSAKEGSKGLAMLKALNGRKVIIYPDIDGYEKWLEASKGLTFFKCIVSDYIEKNSSKEDRELKVDIADWLIRQLKNDSVGL